MNDVVTTLISAETTSYGNNVCLGGNIAISYILDICKQLTESKE